jgi:CDP-glucose 4,6-dehydratase
MSVLMNRGFWEQQRVLITGANGFIGSNVAEALLEQGSAVFALVHDRARCTSILFDRLAGRLHGILEGDVRDFPLLWRTFQEQRIDTCFHFAAQPIVQKAFDDPLPTFEINIQGTINILEAARRHSLKRLVIASTTHVYGDNRQLPYLESFFPQPTRPYETSKACVDLLAQTYHYTYGLPLAISRCTNTYGPGDMNSSRIVPKTILAILRQRQPEIAGGTAKRDYIFITDVVSAYLTLAEQLHRSAIQGQVFNFGSGTVLSAAELAQKIVELSDLPSLGIAVQSAGPAKEIEAQYVSIEKARTLLGWAPQTAIEAGFRKTYTWYKENLHFFPERRNV